MKQIFVILLMGLTIFSCKQKVKETHALAQLPYFNSPDFTPEWTNKTHKIPDFSFTNQHGKTITNKTYQGKIYIADFFFTTCPGICPKLTKNMSILQDSYKADNKVMLLSHSVMPWVDTVDKLKDYAEKNGVDDTKWNLVTGDKDSLYNMARNGYFADEDFNKTQDKNGFIHTEKFILVDKEGYIRGVYNGTLEVDIERLKRHIEILEGEI
ncbi:MAG TPA: SCO family protein [Mariniflexile sp.]